MGASSLLARVRATSSDDTLRLTARFSGWRLALFALAKAAVAVSVGSVVLVASGPPPAARAADASVSIVDFAFDPALVTVTAGDTVTWTVTRAVEPHTVTPVDPPSAFRGSDLLRQGDVFTVTFANPGTYRYQCSIHPEEMQGSVTVIASPPTAGASATAGASLTPTAGASATPAGGSPGPASQSGAPPGTLPSAAEPFPGLGMLLGVAILAVVALAAGAAVLVRRRRGVS